MWFPVISRRHCRLAAVALAAAAVAVQKPGGRRVADLAITAVVPNGPVPAWRPHLSTSR